MSDTTIVGNVTRDPELRFTPTGLATASFAVAVNRKWQNRQTNEWEESVSFFDVVVWREQAENVSSCVAKGDRVIVTGRLEQSRWENDKGEKKSRVQIVADAVGPSLQWATADVTKNARDDNVPPEQRGSRAPAARTQADAGYGFDEEPF